MDITKCDLCKRTIKKDQTKYRVSRSSPWAFADLCERCGKPVELLLEKIPD